MQGKLPAATHYALRQHTSVVKGARDPLRVISISVPLRSAPVITGAFSLHTHQWKSSFETGQDWTSGSLWTDMLSQQTWLLSPSPASPPPTPYIWLCRETRRSTPRSFSQLTQLARLSLLLHQPQPFPSVLDISSKVVRCTSIILFVLWDGGRHVIEYDVAAPPWWWHENRDITGVWLQTKNWKKVRPWNCHLVVGCSKGRWLCLNYRGATPIWIFC